MVLVEDSVITSRLGPPHSCELSPAADAPYPVEHALRFEAWAESSARYPIDGFEERWSCAGGWSWARTVPPFGSAPSRAGSV